MPTSDQPLPREKIGSYRLIRKIGHGGMGEVYEARHEGVGGRAAIKILRLDVASSPSHIERFFDEARAANSIEHPSIIRIFDSGQTNDGVCYLAMEFLDGETLAKRIKTLGKLSSASAIRFARQIASALAAVHSRGVIHRDLKPDNLMIVKDPESAGGERIKVLDFGIARLAADLRTRDGQTESGMILGTPMYMSPEQCHGAKQVTPPSDVYSLGIILYKMLAGRAPFVSQGHGALIAMHLSDIPAPVEKYNPQVPPLLSSLIAEMLAKSPEDRPTMEAIEQRLRAMSNIEDLPAPQSRSETATRKLSTVDLEQTQHLHQASLLPPQATVPLQTLVVSPANPANEPASVQITSPQGRTRRLIRVLLVGCTMVGVAFCFLLFRCANEQPSSASQQVNVSPRLLAIPDLARPEKSPAAASTQPDGQPTPLVLLDAGVPLPEIRRANPVKPDPSSRAVSAPAEAPPVSSRKDLRVEDEESVAAEPVSQPADLAPPIPSPVNRPTGFRSSDGLLNPFPR
ncbi:MAG TPA: protein kinase [Pseudomonadota bacterium]|nr:protein kinase [Pseudomonadota bacterium]